MEVDDRDPFARIKRAQQQRLASRAGDDRDPLARIARATGADPLRPDTAVVSESTNVTRPTGPVAPNAAGVLGMMAAPPAEVEPEGPAPSLAERVDTYINAPVRGAVNATASMVRGLDAVPFHAPTRGLPAEAQEILQEGNREINRRKIEAAQAGETVPSQLAAALRFYADVNFPEDPRLREDFLNQTLQGLGSVVPYVAGGVASGPVSPLVMGSMGVAGSGGQALDEAKAAGATTDETRQAVAMAAPAGAAEAIPLERALGRLVPQPLKKRAVEVLLGSLEEASQETFQQVTQNLAAKATYDPEREVTAGMAESATQGGVVGTIVNLITTSLGARGVTRPGVQTDAPAELAQVVPQGEAAAEAEPVETPTAEPVAAERDPLERIARAEQQATPQTEEEAVEQVEAGSATTPEPAPEAAPVQPEPEAAAEPVADDAAAAVDADVVEGQDELADESEADYFQRVAESSEDPDEILSAYLYAQGAAPRADPKQEAIASFFESGGRVSTASFDAFGDRNTRKSGAERTVALNYLSSRDAEAMAPGEDRSRAARDIDTLAQELSEEAGIEVAPEDVVAFIQNNPSGVGTFRRSLEAPEAQALADRYKQVTGERLTPEEAEALQREVSTFTDEGGALLPGVEGLLYDYTDEAGNIDLPRLSQFLATDEGRGFFTEFPGGLSESEYAALQQEVTEQLGTGTEPAGPEAEAEGTGGPREAVPAGPEGEGARAGVATGDGQQGTPPASPSSPSAPQPEPSPETVALNKAAIAEARETLGLSGLEPAAARRWDRVLQEAIEQEIPAQADAIARAVVAGEQKVLTDAEHAGLVLAAAKKQRRHADTIAQADAALEAGDRSKSEWLRERADGLLASLDLITQASDKAGREVARAMNIRKLRLDAETFDLVPVLRRARVEAQRDLTPEEKRKLEDLVKQVQTYEVKIRDLESRIKEQETKKARTKAQEVLEREVDKRRKAESNPSETAAKKAARDIEREKIRAQRDDIKRDLRALGLRVNDVTGLTAEGSILVGKLALNYAKEGLLTLQDVVDRVQQDLPDLTAEEIIRALAAPKQKQKDRTAEQLDRLRVERRRAQKAVRAAQRALRARPKTAWMSEVLATPRTLMATGDWSSVLRQGAILLPRFPLKSARAFGKAAQAFFSEYKAEEIDLMMRDDPRFFEAEASKLYIAPLGDEAAIATLTAREESFTSRLLQNVPGLGALMEASERHYVTYLNLVRFSAFTHYLDGNPDASREQLTAWADYVNVASGRGDLGSLSQWASRWGSALLFAPRFAVSPFQALLTKPAKYATMPGVNQEIAKTLTAFVTTGVVGLTLAALAFEDEEDAYVGTDPEDSDFGKIVVGNARINFWGGSLSAVRLLVREAMVPYRYATEGEQPSFGKGQWDIFTQWLKYKLGPPPAIAMELSSGKNAIGQDVTPAETALRSVLPLNVTQAVEAGRGSGVKAGAAVFAGQWFGLGVDVYDDPLAGASVKTLLMRADYRPPPVNADPTAFAEEFARRVDGQRASLSDLPPDQLKKRLQTIARSARRSVPKKASD